MLRKEQTPGQLGKEQVLPLEEPGPQAQDGGRAGTDTPWRPQAGCP